MVVANTRGYKPTLLETLCRWGYSLVLAIAIPFAFIHLLIKATKASDDSHRGRFERFGIVQSRSSRMAICFTVFQWGKSWLLHA